MKWFKKTGIEYAIKKDNEFSNEREINLLLDIYELTKLKSKTKINYYKIDLDNLIEKGFVIFDESKKKATFTDKGELISESLFKRKYSLPDKYFIQKIVIEKREMAKITRKQLSEKTGISYSRLTSIEGNASINYIYLEELKSICEVLEIKLSDAFEEASLKKRIIDENSEIRVKLDNFKNIDWLNLLEKIQSEAYIKYDHISLPMVRNLEEYYKLIEVVSMNNEGFISKLTYEGVNFYKRLHKDTKINKNTNNKENNSTSNYKILISESPIETKLLKEIIKLKDTYNFNIETQEDFSINGRKYRADILLEFNDNNNIKKIIIETDGHDFHEKTKEQAQKDKQRDRDFLSAGILTIRFTGSEIWRNASKCAEEIFNTYSGYQKSII